MNLVHEGFSYKEKGNKHHTYFLLPNKTYIEIKINVFILANQL